MRKRIRHEFNGEIIEQRPKDGFINGTAMCQAQGKTISDWLRMDETKALFRELAAQEGIVLNMVNPHISGTSRLSATKYAEWFPGLIIVRQGSPKKGGGTWLHPKLAIALAQ